MLSRFGICLRAHRTERLPPIQPRLKRCRFLPDSHKIALGSIDKTVTVWDVQTGQRLRKLNGHLGEIHSLVFSQDGRQLLTGSYDGYVKSWSIDVEPEINVLGHPDPVSSVAFSPNGKSLASGCVDGLIRIWEVASGQCLSEIPAHGGNVWRVEFLPDSDGKTLVSIGGDSLLKIWDVETGEEIGRRACFANEGNPTALAVSQDGTLAFTASNLDVQLWAPPYQNASESLFLVHARDLAFSPDGCWLVASSLKNVSIWNARTGKKMDEAIGDARAVQCVAFAVDGTTIASGSHTRTIRLWQINKTQNNVALSEKRVFTGHSEVTDVSYSPDGTVLASVGNDQVVRLWDATSGRERAALPGHTAAVAAVRFAPDGQTIASAGDDGTVRLWRAPRDVAGQ